MTQGFRFGPGRCCCERTCEDLSRPICYVDKYATGAGNGTSWADAYISLVTATDAKGATHRIYVKGYGQADRYTGFSSGARPNSVSIHGFNQAWLGETWIGNNGCLTNLNIYGMLTCGENNSIESCTAGHTAEGYLFHCENGGNILTGCIAEDATRDGTFNNVIGFRAISGGCVFNDCIASNLQNYYASLGYALTYGFYTANSTLNNCIASGINSDGIYGSNSVGFYGSGNIITNGVAENITANPDSWDYSTARGFLQNSSSTLTNCTCTSEPANGCIVIS